MHQIREVFVVVCNSDVLCAVLILNNLIYSALQVSVTFAKGVDLMV